MLAIRTPLRMMSVVVCLIAIGPFASIAQAQTPAPTLDVLHLQAEASSTVIPDTAVIVMSVEKQGADSAALNQEVNQIMQRALAESKATKGVEASTGTYQSYPRYDNKGQRNGWNVRAELILKSKDFGALGNLAGKLSTSMLITSNQFEVSRALREQEEAKLQEQALRAFQQKAEQASRLLGYRTWQIREVTLGTSLNQGQPRQPMLAMRAMAMAEAAPVAIEAGQTTLQLTVAGSIQMKP